MSSSLSPAAPSPIQAQLQILGQHIQCLQAAVQQNLTPDLVEGLDNDILTANDQFAKLERTAQETDQTAIAALKRTFTTTVQQYQQKKGAALPPPSARPLSSLALHPRLILPTSAQLQLQASGSPSDAPALPSGRQLPPLAPLAKPPGAPGSSFDLSSAPGTPQRQRRPQTTGALSGAAVSGPSSLPPLPPPPRQAKYGESLAVFGKKNQYGQVRARNVANQTQTDTSVCTVATACVMDRLASLTTTDRIAPEHIDAELERGVKVFEDISQRKGQLGAEQLHACKQTMVDELNSSFGFKITGDIRGYKFEEIRDALVKARKQASDADPQAGLFSEHDFLSQHLSLGEIESRYFPSLQPLPGLQPFPKLTRFEDASTFRKILREVSNSRPESTVSCALTGNGYTLNATILRDPATGATEVAIYDSHGSLTLFPDSGAGHYLIVFKDDEYSLAIDKAARFLAKAFPYTPPEIPHGLSEAELGPEQVQALAELEEGDSNSISVEIRYSTQAPTIQRQRPSAAPASQARPVLAGPTLQTGGPGSAAPSGARQLPPLPPLPVRDPSSATVSLRPRDGVPIHVQIIGNIDREIGEFAELLQNKEDYRTRYSATDYQAVVSKSEVHIQEQILTLETVIDGLQRAEKDSAKKDVTRLKEMLAKAKTLQTPQLQFGTSRPARPPGPAETPDDKGDDAARADGALSRPSGAAASRAQPREEMPVHQAMAILLMSELAALEQRVQQSPIGISPEEFAQEVETHRETIATLDAIGNPDDILPGIVINLKAQLARITLSMPTAAPARRPSGAAAAAATRSHGRRERADHKNSGSDSDGPDSPVLRRPPSGARASGYRGVLSALHTASSPQGDNGGVYTPFADSQLAGPQARPAAAFASAAAPQSPRSSDSEATIGSEDEAAAPPTASAASHPPLLARVTTAPAVPLPPLRPLTSFQRQPSSADAQAPAAVPSLSLRQPTVIASSRAAPRAPESLGLPMGPTAPRPLSAVASPQPLPHLRALPDLRLPMGPSVQRAPSAAVSSAPRLVTDSRATAQAMIKAAKSSDYAQVGQLLGQLSAEDQERLINAVHAKFLEKHVSGVAETDRQEARRALVTGSKLRPALIMQAIQTTFGL